MKLTPWRRHQPAHAMRAGDDIWERLSDLFEGPFSGFENHLPEVFRGRGFPAVNVSETETDFTITAELPGLDEDDVQVEVMNQQLVITGERKWEDATQDREFHRVESQFGRFHRTVALPAGLVTTADSVKATYEKGILEVTFPKVEPTPSAKIEVRTK